MATITDAVESKHKRQVIDRAVIRFCGDSGDGMQISGSQFTNTAALYGNDLATFMTIMRTGHDFDQLHLNCSNVVKDNCYQFPVNGAVLQVMPWPLHANMTDRQLKAIWTYLSTVPCNAHNDALGDKFPWLKNDC